MGHHKLRNDKECQNCGHTVELEYCSKCGQQNTETRQSFHHLITHMFEDITHYDGNFWKTIKYLMFRPGKLTIEYLQGHRMRYVPPVKLYIFISFVCFFLMAVMAPEAEYEGHGKKHVTKSVGHQPETKETHHVIKADTAKTVTVKNVFNVDTFKESNINVKVKDTIVRVNGVALYNVHQLDSLQESLPEEKKLPLWEYYDTKLDLKANSKELTARDIIIGLAHTIPKVLFIYMPLFAFWLWLLHGKKRWYFFDHGIFTLHYFSFLLLVTTINMAISWAGDLCENNSFTLVYEIIKGIIGTTSFVYSFFYFFRSHRRFYGETKAISRIKSILLFFINAILIIAMTLGTTAYVLLHTH